MGLLDFLKPKPAKVAKPVRATRSVKASAADIDWDEVEVVGESHYQDALWKIVGKKPRGDDGVEWTGTARLVPEPANPHDPNAILVTIKGQPVGHLSRGSARQLRRAIGSGVSVPCAINGGFRKRDGQRASLGVVLGEIAVAMYKP
jgi:hypothetical protein